MKRAAAVVFMSLLAGCANPINLATADRYFRTGVAQEQKEKWFDARMAFGRAWTNAQLGKADDQVTAVYAYEYGRASGAICDWAEAERGLTRAYELDKLSSGPMHMSMAELARMYHAKGDLVKSEQFFSMAKAEFDRLQADTRDAIGYADILAEYADVMSAMGKTGDAGALKKREDEIRNVFKGRASHMDRTPYGKFCDQKSPS